MTDNESYPNSFGISLLRNKQDGVRLGAGVTSSFEKSLALDKSKPGIRGVQDSRPSLGDRGINQTFKLPSFINEQPIEGIGRDQRTPARISLPKHNLKRPMIGAGIVSFKGALLALDLDGARHAYHINNEGIDENGNGGINKNEAQKNSFSLAKNSKGGWLRGYGIVTQSDKKKTERKGYIQPGGFFVSETSLKFKNINRENPDLYVDAEKIPYLALRKDMTAKGIKMGDIALVINEYNKLYSFAIFADAPPDDSIRIEISLALANELKVPVPAQQVFSYDGKKKVTKYSGITNRPLKIYAFKGSGDGHAKTFDEIKTIGIEYIEYIPELNTKNK